MYETAHEDGRNGMINYTVWSEVFSCPECGGEVVFLDEGLDASTGRVKDGFPCPHCSASLTKDNLQRRMDTLVDPDTKKPWKRVRFIPAIIHYSVGTQRYQKKPDSNDLETLRRIADLPLHPCVPTAVFPIDRMYHGSRLAPKGFTHIYHLYFPRAAHALGALWQRANEVPDRRLRNAILFWSEQALWGLSILNRYSPLHYSQVNRYLNGVYYVASQVSECSVWYNLEGKLSRLVAAFRDIPASRQPVIVSTSTAK